MRTDKELIQILIDNIDKLDTGLCGLTGELEISRVINCEEEYRLDKIIRINKPKSTFGVFYFYGGDKESRLEFLKSLPEYQEDMVEITKSQYDKVKHLIEEYKVGDWVVNTTNWHRNDGKAYKIKKFSKGVYLYIEDKEYPEANDYIRNFRLATADEINEAKYIIRHKDCPYKVNEAVAVKQIEKTKWLIKYFKEIDEFGEYRFTYEKNSNSRGNIFSIHQKLEDLNKGL